MPTRNKTCEERKQRYYDSVMSDIREIMKSDDPFWEGTEDDGSLNEYGLSFDYVEAGTFEGQRAPYYRWQIAWGGPGYEFRMFLNDEIEFWFLDWFDGAKIDLDGDDRKIVKEVMDYFAECCPPRG